MAGLTLSLLPALYRFYCVMSRLLRRIQSDFIFYFPFLPGTLFLSGHRILTALLLCSWLPPNTICRQSDIRPSDSLASCSSEAPHGPQEKSPSSSTAHQALGRELLFTVQFHLSRPSPGPGACWLSSCPPFSTLCLLLSLPH